MRASFFLLLLLLLPVPAQASCVVLLHGLARTNASMDGLENRLQENGFVPVNVGYPSTDYPIEVLAEMAITPALELCPAGAQVHFVTHSLGGILVRQYLSSNELPELGRVVMLGPPNNGSEVVDKLADMPGFYFINGEAGMQLGTGELGVPGRLGPAVFDVGIIAGNRSVNPILSTLIPGDDDGKVSVERTRLEGMGDHLEMPVTHTFMMQNADVMAQVVHYLNHGRFKRAPEYIGSVVESGARR